MNLKTPLLKVLIDRRVKDLEHIPSPKTGGMKMPSMGPRTPSFIPKF